MIDSKDSSRMSKIGSQNFITRNLVDPNLVVISECTVETISEGSRNIFAIYHNSIDPLTFRWDRSGAENIAKDIASEIERSGGKPEILWG